MSFYSSMDPEGRLILGLIVALTLGVLGFTALMKAADKKVQDSVDRALAEEQVGDDTLALFGTDEPEVDVVAKLRSFNTAEEVAEWLATLPAVREVMEADAEDDDEPAVFGPRVMAERKRLRDELAEHAAALRSAERMEYALFDLLHDARTEADR